MCAGDSSPAFFVLYPGRSDHNVTGGRGQMQRTSVVAPGRGSMVKTNQLVLHEIWKVTEYV